MKVSLFHDQPGYIGGAELTMQEFADSAPDGVEVVKGLDHDTVILGNVVHLSPDAIEKLKGKKVVWFHNDLSPHINSELQDWLDLNAEHIFCSPLQRDKYGLDGEVIPPAMDLEPFRDRRNGRRHSAVSIAQWRNPGKGAHLLAEWAKDNGHIDVYGDGGFLPVGPNVDLQGPLEQEDIPRVLGAYKTFVFLPFEIEPFCRSVVEAWAAGCNVITNNLIGARYWIDEAPEKLETAAEDFWKVVL